MERASVLECAGPPALLSQMRVKRQRAAALQNLAVHGDEPFASPMHRDREPIQRWGETPSSPGIWTDRTIRVRRSLTPPKFMVRDHRLARQWFHNSVQHLLIKILPGMVEMGTRAVGWLVHRQEQTSCSVHWVVGATPFFFLRSGTNEDFVFPRGHSHFDSGHLPFGAGRPGFRRSSRDDQLKPRLPACQNEDGYVPPTSRVIESVRRPDDFNWPGFSDRE